MRKIQILIPLMIVASFSASAKPAKQNPKGNWNAVKSLAIGTPISVLAPNSHHLLCYFERATDDELFCQPLSPAVTSGPYWPYPFPYPRPQPRLPMEYAFKRGMVQQVRLEHSEDSNQLIGAGVGAAAGAGIGASAAGSSKGAAAIIGSIPGALIGGLIGRMHPLFHRHVIYKQ